MYEIGGLYSRADIYKILSVPKVGQGGDWLNGYHRHESDYYIFCNIGVAGRTGHDYENFWDGDRLVWYGKNGSHFGQPAIQNLLSGDYRVLVFYRTEDRAPFTYAGVGQPVPDTSVERPVRIDWVFGSDTSEELPAVPDEYVPGATYVEGTRTRVLVNRYERDRRARDTCIRHHGAVCKVCDFNFEAVYGELGKGFIHVHHTVPISEIGEGYTVDPIADLVPVCPNCHAMLHRRNPPLSIIDLKNLLKCIQ